MRKPSRWSLVATIGVAAAFQARSGAGPTNDLVYILLKGMEARAASITSARMFELYERYYQPLAGGALEKRATLNRYEFDGPLYRNEQRFLTPLRIAGHDVVYREMSYDGVHFSELLMNDSGANLSGAVTLKSSQAALGPAALDLYTTRRAIESARPMSSKRERLFGHDCYHLQAIGPDGTEAHWWIAPDMDCLFLQVKVIMPFKTVKSPSGLARKVNLWRGMKFEKIDGHWVRSVTRLDKTVVFPDGREQWMVCEVKELRKVELNVTFEDASFALRFPIGTSVVIEDGESGEVGGKIDATKRRLVMSTLASIRHSLDADYPVDVTQ